MKSNLRFKKGTLAALLRWAAAGPTARQEEQLEDSRCDH